MQIPPGQTHSSFFKVMYIRDCVSIMCLLCGCESMCVYTKNICLNDKTICNQSTLKKLEV